MNFRKVALDTLDRTSKVVGVSDYQFYDENVIDNLKPVSKTTDTTIRFMKTTTADAIASVAERCVALNFASAKYPGGGFLRNAIAQEEDLCRKTSLYHSIVKCESFYKSVKGTIYTDRVIYSPKVILIRDEFFNIIEPIRCSVITCAAPNNVDDHDNNLLQETFERRIGNVLNVAQEHGHSTFILGAWGCGAFKNDPKLVATAFKKVITRYSFERLIFAIPDDKNLDVFKDILL